MKSLVLPLPTQFSGVLANRWNYGFVHVRMYFSTFEGKFREMKLKSAQTQVSRWDVGSSRFEPAHAFGPGAMDTRELAVSAIAHDAHGHSESIPQSPWTMTLPLMVLAVPSMLMV